MDFAKFPPEINSGLMYAGPGSSTMLAASAAWDGLAAELRSAATGYGSAILDLTDAGWQGPSSASMAAAAAPYVAWLHNTAEQAEQAGMQAAAAAAAHEAAFAATVPPAVIAANRSQLMVLIASNVIGIHTPAIAATEAHYGEMWAQDAAAMYAYAASSVMAATLAPMAAAPATTNPVGLAGGTIANLQGAAQGLATQVQMGLSAIPSELNAAGSSLVSDLESGVGNLANLLGMPFGQGAGPGGSGTPATPNPGIGTPIAPPHMVLRPPSMPATPALPTMRVTPLMPAAPERLMPSAALGQATSVGGLSVPSGWSPASAPSAATPAVAPLMGAPGGSPMAARSIPATTVGGMEMRAPAASEPPRVSVLARSVVG